MGLDMYLNANRYLASYDQDAFDLANKIAELIGLQRREDRLNDEMHVKELTIEAAYWRKANAIHDWFVKNIQDGEDDCRSYDVGRDELRTLVDLCEKVLANHDLANELLPTTSGFFFGSTEYDEWYFKGLEYTAKRLREILENPVFKNMWFSYQSSW